MNCNNEILSSEAERISYVVEQYHKALDLLDAYDHQTLGRPRGQKGTTQFTYEECKRVIAGMSFCEQSSLFGNEKDDSFRGSIGAIYQTYAGSRNVSFCGGKSRSSSLFCCQKSLLFRWKQTNCRRPFSLFPSQKWDFVGYRT